MSDSQGEKRLKNISQLYGDLTKLQITLSGASIVLSVTFLDKLFAGQAIPFLLAAWSSLGLSIFFGFLVVGQLITYAIESKSEFRRGESVEYFNLAQWILLALGVALLAYFAVVNVTTPQEPSRALSILLDSLNVSL